MLGKVVSGGSTKEASPQPNSAGEAAGADGDAAGSHPGRAEITQGGCTEPQVFHVHQTASYGKKTPPGAFLAGGKSVSGFKAAKGRLTPS